MASEIDADLSHHLRGERVNITGGLGTGTGNVKRSAQRLAENSLRKVGSAGVSGAEDEDGRFHEGEDSEVERQWPPQQPLSRTPTQRGMARSAPNTGAAR